MRPPGLYRDRLEKTQSGGPWAQAIALGLRQGRDALRLFSSCVPTTSIAHAGRVNLSSGCLVMGLGFRGSGSVGTGFIPGQGVTVIVTFSLVVSAPSPAIARST